MLQVENCATPEAQAHSAAHDARPAKTKSRSTSCDGGTSPSAPKTPGSSNKLSATTLAAVHANKEPQRKRQACSARRRRIHPSSRARLLMNRCVVEDHLPPTSMASTTRRALARGPTSSGYRCSLRRSATEIAAPSL